MTPARLRLLGGAQVPSVRDSFVEVDAMQQDENPTTSKVRFHYLKSTGFRVVVSDGVIGGLTPSGFLHLAFYNERPAIPKTTEQNIDEFGNLIGKAEVIESKVGIVREIEFDVLLNRDSATDLRDFLTERLKDFDSYESARSTAQDAAKNRDKNV